MVFKRQFKLIAMKLWLLWQVRGAADGIYSRGQEVTVCELELVVLWLALVTLKALCFLMNAGKLRKQIFESWLGCCFYLHSLGTEGSCCVFI